nr:MAG: coat protein [Leviviridae sp.]
MTSKFGYTNVTASGKTITPVAIAPVQNYAKVVDEPNTVVLSNKTCPLDQGELLTFRVNDVNKVSTSQTIQNPTRVKNGVQYVAKLEEILRTSTQEGEVICDEPVVAYLTIRHQKSGNITSAMITEVVNRLLGSVQKADGTFRWDDLMRSAIVPITD